MIKKLLKYDLRATFKFWWIAALITVGLAFAGGGCMALLGSERELPEAVGVISILALILIIMSLSVFIALSFVLIIVRFYKNFFTDEGYLTFTLPVKRNELINSKLISAMALQGAAVLVLIIDVVIMLSVGFGREPFDAIFNVLGLAASRMGVYFYIYLVEGLVLLILTWLFSLLLAFCCITFASVITKKARVITAIGIYYGAYSIISFFTQMLAIFGIDAIFIWFGGLSDATSHILLMIMFLGGALFLAMLCALLYTAQHFMLDRKLNLS